MKNVLTIHLSISQNQIWHNDEQAYLIMRSLTLLFQFFYLNLKLTLYSKDKLGVICTTLSSSSQDVERRVFFSLVLPLLISKKLEKYLKSS